MKVFPVMLGPGTEAQSVYVRIDMKVDRQALVPPKGLRAGSLQRGKGRGYVRAHVFFIFPGKLCWCFAEWMGTLKEMGSTRDFLASKSEASGLTSALLAQHAALQQIK